MQIFYTLLLCKFTRCSVKNTEESPLLCKKKNTAPKPQTKPAHYDFRIFTPGLGKSAALAHKVYVILALIWLVGTYLKGEHISKGEHFASR